MKQKTKTKTPIEKFLALSDAQKDAEVAEFEKGEIPLSKTRPLNAKQRKQWRRIKRKMGRPTIGAGAKHVDLTIERDFLKRVDQYAKSRNLKRSELVARALEREVAMAS